ncbi:MAG: hypothetical protein KY453_11710, partial [Gemmatimonadetes bacterium]|nr:hypothetical protein [Gemmatimonadota bacterium]
GFGTGVRAARGSSLATATLGDPEGYAASQELNLGTAAGVEALLEHYNPTAGSWQADVSGGPFMVAPSCQAPVVP